MLSTALARLKFVEAAHETTYINAKGEPPMHWLYLYTAIILEVCGTLSLRASNQFSNKYAFLIPLFYIASFYLLSKAMAQISISIAYAVWSGAGIVALAVIGHFFLKDRLDFVSLALISVMLCAAVGLQLRSSLPA